MTLRATDLGGRVVSPLRVGNVEMSPKPIVALVMKDSWTNAVAANPTALLSAGVLGPNASTKLVSTFDGIYANGVSATARNVTISVTAAAVVAVSGVITGKDARGNTVTEAWSVPAGGASQLFTGSVVFKSVTSISITAVGDATSDTIRAGIGGKLGLSFAPAVAKVIAETEDGVAPATPGVIALPSGTERRGTYTPFAALDGVKDFTVWYLVEDVTL